MISSSLVIIMNSEKEAENMNRLLRLESDQEPQSTNSNQNNRTNDEGN